MARTHKATIPPEALPAEGARPSAGRCCRVATHGPGSMTARCVRVARLHQTIGTSCSGSIRFDTRLLLGGVADVTVVCSRRCFTEEFFVAQQVLELQGQGSLTGFGMLASSFAMRLVFSAADPSLPEHEV